MALSKGYDDFRDMVLAYVKTGNIPEGYLTLDSFTAYIASKTAADLYFVKDACEKELAKNSSFLEGTFKYAFSSYKAQAEQNTLFKQRLELIIPQTLGNLHTQYKEELRDETEIDCLRYRLNQRP